MVHGLPSINTKLLSISKNIDDKIPEIGKEIVENIVPNGLESKIPDTNMLSGAIQEQISDTLAPMPGSGPTSSDASISNDIKKPNFESFTSIFKIFYIIINLLCVILLSAIVILSFIDIIYYIAKEIKQKNIRRVDKTLYIKDTTDYKIYDYATISASSVSEPQNIYLSMYIVKSILVLAVAFIFLVAFHIIIFSILKSRKTGIFESLNMPYKIMFPILIVILAGCILTVYYNSYFMKNILKQLITYKNEMIIMKDEIYKLMSVDIDLLNVLSRSNNNEIVTKFANIINNNQIDTLKSGLITYSLMDYYKKNIPEIDINYENVMNIFKYEQISRKSINPINYFLYKKPPHISNIWAIIRDDIKTVLEDRNKLNNTSFFNTQKEKDIIDEVDVLIININKKLTKLNYISQGKKKVLIYIVLYFVIAFLFLVLVFIYIILFEPGIDSIKKFIMKNVINR